MQRYLVERYLTAAEGSGVADHAARLSASDSPERRLLLTLYSPEDETCFHLFDAASSALIEDAGRDAGLVLDKVVQVVELRHQEPVDHAESRKA
jgi:hypothetical protein